MRTSGLDAAFRDPWFSGYESEPRWLRLAASEAGVRCINSGFELDPPLDERLAARFKQVCDEHGAVDGAFLPVTQVDRDGHLVDTEDRVQKCAGFLKDLVAAGL